MNLHEVLTDLCEYAADSGPWFLAGIALSAAIQRWFKARWIERWLSGDRSSVVVASLAGAMLPGCAVTTMPLAAAFKAKGVKVGTLTAFIMIAPILSPHTLAFTAVLLGPEMAAGRFILPFLLSLVLGWLLNATASFWPSPTGADVKPSGHAHEHGRDACCESGCADGPAGFLRTAWQLFKDLTPYFAGGLLVVALLKQFVPQEALTGYMKGGWLAYAAAAAAGIPLYVCEGAEVPLTLALMKLGVGPGPAFTFLLGSVGTCLPTISMAPRIIGLRATWIYVLAWLVLSIGGGWLFSFVPQ